MRHSSQNRRSRSRTRKGPNPLTRSYESNGPDVKVRGTASHVAEKYTTLARDAHSSGDFVAAENYLQHAEHYNRIVMAAQTQYQQSQQPPQSREGQDESYDDDRQMNGRYRFNGDGGRPGDDEGDERFEAEDEDDRFAPQQTQPQQSPRPPRQDDRNRPHGGRPERDRYEYRGQPERSDRYERSERNDRSDRNDRPDQRNEQGDRSERTGRNAQADRNYRADQNDRPERGDRSEENDGPERSERAEQSHPAARRDQPEERAEAAPQQVEGPSPEAAPAEAISGPKRRRSGRSPRVENDAPPEPGQDLTRDGEAALAAFPE